MQEIFKTIFCLSHCHYIKFIYIERETLMMKVGYHVKLLRTTCWRGRQSGRWVILMYTLHAPLVLPHSFLILALTSSLFKPPSLSLYSLHSISFSGLQESLPRWCCADKTRPDTSDRRGRKRGARTQSYIIYIIAVKLKDWQPSFQHYFTNKQEKEEWPQTFVPSQVKIIFSCTSINQAISANTNANTKLALWALLLQWGKKVLILDHSQNFYVIYIHSFGFLRNVLISPFRNLSGVSPWIK